MSPFNAWLHLKSLETLELRMQRHCENAEKVAGFLASQKKITKVLYPFRPDHPQHNLARAQMSGGGGVVAFEVEGGKKAAFRLANALGLIDISNNLGDTKSLITHPDYLVGSRERSVYVDLLRHLTALRDESRLWVALPGELNRWWRNRERMTLVPAGNGWRIEGPDYQRARLAYAELDGDRVVYRLA